jgi:hypothetical protein
MNVEQYPPSTDAAAQRTAHSAQKFDIARVGIISQLPRTPH